nr:reverse transcriptase domain-containing protein [Tanacetum cinerariifolium]
LKVTASLPTQTVNSPSNTSIRALPVLRNDLPELRPKNPPLKPFVFEEPELDRHDPGKLMVGKPRADKHVLDQDSLNFAAGGNFLDKMPRECIAIIERKYKVHYSRKKPVVAKVSTNTSTSGISSDVVELKDMVKALLLDKKSQSPAPVKAVKESCITYGGSHSYHNCPATDGNVYRDNI